MYLKADHYGDATDRACPQECAGLSPAKGNCVLRSLLEELDDHISTKNTVNRKTCRAGFVMGFCPLI